MVTLSLASLHCCCLEFSFEILFELLFFALCTIGYALRSIECRKGLLYLYDKKALCYKIACCFEGIFDALCPCIRTMFFPAALELLR